jgi:hypothetical protein
VQKMYYIGNTNDGGTIFWNINKDLKVQKSKICYYKKNGKRTSKFKVPYKNKDGYFNCLYGEYLLNKYDKPTVLVESKKTIIHIPSVNSGESTGKGQKVNEVDSIIDTIGVLEYQDQDTGVMFVKSHKSDKIIKVADLVYDVQKSRDKIQEYLRKRKVKIHNAKRWWGGRKTS